MNPTNELLAKLDELGVEYDTYDLPNGNHGVSWIDGNNIEWEVVPLGENFEIHALQLVTPAQAIAATVGRCDTMGLWHEWEQVLFANVSDEVAQDNLNECVHELLDKAATVGGSDVSALRAKVKAQSDYIGKLRGEYKMLDEQMERRCAEHRATIRKLKAELDAATVGEGTLTAEQVRECVKGVYFEGYGDGATHRVNGIEETDWQAIADKLNVTVGTGTCKLVIEKHRRHGPWIYHFGCGYDFWQPTDCPMPILKHCPNCGNPVKKVGE